MGEYGIEVAADPAPALQGGVSLPVAGDRLVPFGGPGFPWSGTLFVQSTLDSRVNSHT